MKKIKILSFILCLALVLAFGGCRVGERDLFITTGSDFSAFSIGKLKCPKNEAYFYVACFEDYYETIGSVSIRSEGEDSVIDDLVKDGALALLSRIYSLNLYALENDIELGAEEEELVKKAGEEYFEEIKATGEVVEGMDVSPKEIIKMYGDYALALKVYMLLMQQADATVSEDEARVMDAYVIEFSNPEKAGELENRIRNREDFGALTQVYSEGDKKIRSFGRGTFPLEVEDVCFHLEDNEVSEQISAGGLIYYVKCISKYNSEASEINKQKIIEQRHMTLITNIVNDQKEKYYSEINEDFFDNLDLSTLKISKGKRFFEKIEEAFGFEL